MVGNVFRLRHIRCIGLVCTGAANMDNLNLIEFYFNLGLTYNDILQVLPVRHNVTISLKTGRCLALHEWQSFARESETIASTNFLQPPMHHILLSGSTHQRLHGFDQAKCN